MQHAATAGCCGVDARALVLLQGFGVVASEPAQVAHRLQGLPAQRLAQRWVNQQLLENRLGLARAPRRFGERCPTQQVRGLSRVEAADRLVASRGLAELPVRGLVLGLSGKVGYLMAADATEHTGAPEPLPRQLELRGRDREAAQPARPVIAQIAQGPAVGSVEVTPTAVDRAELVHSVALQQVAAEGSGRDVGPARGVGHEAVAEEVAHLWRQADAPQRGGVLVTVGLAIGSPVRGHGQALDQACVEARGRERHADLEQVVSVQSAEDVGQLVLEDRVGEARLVQVDLAAPGFGHEASSSAHQAPLLQLVLEDEGADPPRISTHQRGELGVAEFVVLGQQLDLIRGQLLGVVDVEVGRAAQAAKLGGDLLGVDGEPQRAAQDEERDRPQHQRQSDCGEPRGEAA